MCEMEGRFQKVTGQEGLCEGVGAMLDTVWCGQCVET